MEIDVSTRAAGKTTRLIDWLKITPKGILLTFNTTEADRLRRKYPELRNQIHSWNKWSDAQRGTSRDLEIVIDNADYILQSYLSHSLKKITMTKDENR